MSFQMQSSDVGVTVHSKSIPTTEQIKFETSVNGFTLVVNIDKYLAKVISSDIINTNPKITTDLINQFKKDIIGLPPIEVNDHLTINLENKFRKDGRTQVSGVQSPKNSESFWKDIQSACRIIYQLYVKESGIKNINNFYRKQTSSEWKNTTLELKLQKIIQTVGLLNNNIIYSIHRIEDDNKVYIQFDETSQDSERQKFLFDSEIYLRNQLEPTIEVFSTEMKDENSLRKKRGI